MRYIIKITNDENKIKYYKGIKKNPYLKIGHLADWSSEKSEAKIYTDKESVIKEAHSLNMIAIVVTTQVVEIDEGKENCILSLEASDAKKKAIHAVDEFVRTYIANSSVRR